MSAAATPPAALDASRRYSKNSKQHTHQRRRRCPRPVAAAASCRRLSSSPSPSARPSGPMVVGGSLLPAVPSYTDHAAMAEEDWDWMRCLIGWFIRRFQPAQ
jgi:hypothetical protein